MKIVFARTTAVVGHVTVVHGSHWPASDPIVKQYPTLFTDDPRFGMSFSIEPNDDEANDRSVVAEQATRAPGERRTPSVRK